MTPGLYTLHNDCGQVVHTHVALFPSSVIWYQPGGDGAAGKVTVSLALHLYHYRLNGMPHSVLTC